MEIISGMKVENQKQICIKNQSGATQGIRREDSERLGMSGKR